MYSMNKTLSQLKEIGLQPIPADLTHEDIVSMISERPEALNAILTIGVSGSGKSTWAEKFSNVPESNPPVTVDLCSRDQIRDDLSNGEYSSKNLWDWKREPEVTEAVGNIIDAVKWNQYFSYSAASISLMIIHDTNLNHKFRKSLVGQLLDSNNNFGSFGSLYYKICDDFDDPRVLINRIVYRAKTTGRIVPMDVLCRQMLSFWDREPVAESLQGDDDLRKALIKAELDIGIPAKVEGFINSL